MRRNPYEVLGVAPSAGNDEIKRAYRDLSRKYHPDSYINNPLSDLAEEKFKEIQEAYDQIMKEREGGYGYSNNYSGNANGHSTTSSQEAVELQAARNFINSRHFREALNVLAGIPNRGAMWYYYSSIANMGLGNNLIAMDHANQAARLEPGNMEYVNFANQLQFRGQRYQTTGYNYGRPTYSTGNLCCDLWCADSICECMGGDLCSCC